MSTWLDGFERMPITGPSGGELAGGSYVELTRSGVPAPWRLVMHTTEIVAPLEAIVAGYGRTRAYPHVTADPLNHRKAQHIDLDRSVTTAKNAAGGVETNRLHAVQVELVGVADEAWSWSASTLEWIGGEVIAPICAAKSIDPHPYRDVGVDSRDGWVARPDAAQRMPADEWERFNGVCGHQHLPENDHYDPGRFNYGLACAAARFVNTAALSVSAKEEPVPEYLLRWAATGHIFAVYPSGRVRWLADGAEADHLAAVTTIALTSEQGFQQALADAHVVS